MAFGTAKKLDSKAAAPKGKAKDRDVIELPNIEQLAHLHAIIRVAKGAITAIEGTLKEDVFENVFMRKIEETGQKPESVNAKEGNALMNIQFKRRAITSPLADDEIVAMAKAVKIEVGEIPTDEDELNEFRLHLVVKLEKKGINLGVNTKVQKLYAINPEYATNEKLMNKLEETLKKNGFAGDIVVVQDEVKTYVVSDTTMANVCSKKNADLVRPCAVLGFKPTLDVVEPEKIAKTLGEILAIDLRVGSDDKKLAEEVIKVSKAKATKARKLETA